MPNRQPMWSETLRISSILGGASLLLVLWTSPAPGQDKPDEKPPDEIPLSATFVTEGALPVTEIEGGFSFAKSDTDRTYQFGFSSLQYAWGNTFGLKLVVPFNVIDPRGDDPTVAGLGDIELLAKYAAVVSPTHLFALATGVKLTVPTGSKSRGLGGTLAVAPGLFAGKAWRLGETTAVVQMDAFYSWQLNDPARIEGDDPDVEFETPDREQRVSANLTAAVAPLRWLTGIVEFNTSTIVEGDPALRSRVQFYVTPGLSVEPAAGWSIRAGVQVPVTSAKEFDYNVIFLVTKGF